MSIVRVFRMKSAKKNRSAVISAVGSFSVNSNTMDYLRFSAEKYGESSYRLTFDERPAGEYGIIVSNPNNVDEKMVIVSTFAIDGGAGRKSKTGTAQFRTVRCRAILHRFRLSRNR